MITILLIAITITGLIFILAAIETIIYTWKSF